MVMEELDIADRSLTRLMGWYDHWNAQGFLSAEAQAQSEPYNKGVSMIVPLIEAGGGEGPRQMQPCRRSATPARKRSLSARWPRASSRRARHVATPKRSGRGVDVSVTLESSGDDHGTDIVPSQGSDSEDTNSAARPDDPDRELRRQGSPEPTEGPPERPEPREHPEQIDEAVAGETLPSERRPDSIVIRRMDIASEAEEAEDQENEEPPSPRGEGRGDVGSGSRCDQLNQERWARHVGDFRRNIHQREKGVEFAQSTEFRRVEPLPPTISRCSSHIRDQVPTNLANGRTGVVFIRW
jgi:hypothetical protein